MKRIAFLSCVVILSLTACKRVLDTTPPGLLTPENSYTSAAQINAALSGIYVNLKYQIGYSQYYTAYANANSDESYFYNTGFPYVVYANTPTDASTGNTANFWKACYQSILYANTLLDYIDVSSAGRVDPGVVRRAKGEAYFLRGFHYFLLAQWFGDVPLQLHSTTDPLQGQIARTPVKQVYNQIIADMTLADSLLYDQTFASLGYSEKISQDGVDAMLARVCLYAAGQPVNDTKRYTDAEYWAQKVINSGQHALLSSYSQVFIDECKNNYNRENIWEIGFNQKGTGTISAGGGIGIYCGVPNTASTGTNSVTGATLYDSGYCYGYVKLHPRLYFSYPAGDLRRDWNIGNYTFTSAIKVPVAYNKYWSRTPAKWRREYEPQVSRSVQVTSGTNFPVIRYADVLLMLAEAENELNGPTATALNAINQVRARSISATAIIDYVNTTSQGSGYTVTPAVSISGGGGTGAVATAYMTGGKVSILLVSQGSGYTSAPTITIGNAWAASTAYTVGTQVVNAGKLYTVSIAGVSTATGPTQTAGASSAATTGAVFTYAGAPAAATAVISATPVVALSGLSQDSLRQAIRDERYRELAFEALRIPDLKRWGILVTTIQGMAADINGANTKFPLIPSVIAELGAGTDAVPLAPTVNIGPKDMFWPIPLYEVSLDKLMVQNPGY